MTTAVKSGVDIVQLRDKAGSARNTLALARKIQKILAGRIAFIVNDRVDIAHLSGAAGVHVGQEDLPISEARKILGNRKIIGTSCQNLSHIAQAQKDGADYIGFGSVFKTLTKPERLPMDPILLRRAAKAAAMPMFAIGGVTGENIPVVLEHGVRKVAVCRDILLADDVAFSVGNIQKALDRH